MESEKENQILAETLKKISLAFPNAHVQERLWENDKSLTFAAELDGQKVIIKANISKEEYWQSQFQHELDVYSNFSETPPLFNTPRKIAANREHEILILERLKGSSISLDRYPTTSVIKESEHDEIFGLLNEVRSYKTGSVIDRNLIENSRHQRFQKYLRSGIFIDDDSAVYRKAFDNTDWLPAFSHGDPNPTNFFRTSKGLFLIDWEYSALQPPLHDLGSLWAFCFADNALRRKIEALIVQLPDPQRSFFWLNALLASGKALDQHRLLPGENPLRSNIPAILGALQHTRTAANH